MFEVSWSELLILGLVTLIFVGPKELPRFLGTLGRYVGVVRRHANEFRAVFEQAMREAEMEEIQKEIRGVKDGVKASLDEAVRSADGIRQAAKIEDAGKGAAETKAVEAATPAIAPPDADAEAAPRSDPDPEAGGEPVPASPSSEPPQGPA